MHNTSLILFTPIISIKYEYNKSNASSFQAHFNNNNAANT